MTLEKDGIDYSIPFEVDRIFQEYNTVYKNKICIEWSQIRALEEVPKGHPTNQRWEKYIEVEKFCLFTYTDQYMIIGSYKEAVKKWKTFKKLMYEKFN